MSGFYFKPLERVFLNLSGGTVTGDTIFTEGVYGLRLTGDTIYSGNTNLETIIRDLIISDAYTFVQPGVNITTGGTPMFPIINLSDDISLNSVNASIVSGITFLSAGTSLDSVIRDLVNSSTHTFVQPGSNITTGGTANLPSINLLDNIILSSITTDYINSNNLNINNNSVLNTVTASTLFVNSIQLNTSYSGNSMLEGKFYWDEEDGTISLGMHGNNVLQQIGLEYYYYVKNQSGALIENGKVVRASGTLGSSGRITADYMIADGTIPAKYSLGIATEDINNGDDGYVTEFGVVRGINTTGSIYGETWNDGDILWVSSNNLGGLTNVRPTAPNLHIEMAIVLRAHKNGSLFVRPHRYPALNDLQQVSYSSGTENNGDILQWNETSETWNKTNSPSFQSISAVTFYGDGSQLLGIEDYYTTAATLVGQTVFFDRNDQLSAYTLDLSSLSGIPDTNTFVTGFTYNENKFEITDNNGGIFNTTINTMTGLTVSGNLSATTFYGDGSQLTGIPKLWTDGGNTSLYPTGFGTTTSTGFGSITAAYNSLASSFYGSIWGGLGHTNSAYYAAIVGGLSNSITSTASQNYGFIGGGRVNVISGTARHGVILGGESNQLTAGNHSAIVGGVSSTISNQGSFIGGGSNHTISWNYSGLIGGRYNTIHALYSFQGGSYSSDITGWYSGIVGGIDNNVTGYYSGIFGGRNNTVTHANSIALGGSGLTSTADNTVYVPFLNINNIESGTPINNLGIDSSGKVIIGTSYVPYTGATTDVDLGQNDLIVGSASTFVVDTTNRRVGVNIASPSYDFQVKSGTAYALNVGNVSNQPIVQIRNSGNLGLVLYGYANDPVIAGYSSLAFKKASGTIMGIPTGNNLMYLNFANEKVQIGTGTPTNKLDINGDVRVRTLTTTTSATTYTNVVADTNGVLMTNKLFYIGVNFETSGVTWNYISPEVFKINSIDNPSSITYDLLHNGTGYTLTNVINLWDNVSITGTTSTGLLKLNCELI